jgi:type IV secretion system protein VirB3
MQSEAIFKGATRPAMKFGVPLVPLVVFTGVGMLLCLYGGLFVGGWTLLVVAAGLLPGFLWMRMVTARDDQRFRQMLLAARLTALHRNGRFWQARSYSPSTPKGARDDWRA